ncbi:MAG: PRTRC system protein E, partial [Tunicatimonas sp.]|uniref:PRTRC system protein E n=1 Tax=Tunicatimonas sp. TaxID=1940096 RepID=UPI003C77FCCF
MNQSPPLSTVPAKQDAQQEVNHATNFFTGISRYTEHSDITLTLRKLPDGRLAVSLLPKPTMDDRVKDQIAPFTLKALPSALDEGFFAHIHQPLTQVSAFSVDLSAWEASQKKAEAESQKAKKAKEEEEKKRKKSDTHLARASELLD